MASFVYTLDKSVPTDATALSTIDTVFQDMTKALVERNNIDHIWDYGDDADVNVVDSADVGKHRHVVFGVVYADGEDAFDSGVLATDQTALYVRYSNDTADDDQELYWYDGDNTAVRLTRSGKINLPFADIWYGLDDDDSPLDFGSVMAEEYFVFSAGICDLVDGGIFNLSDVELTEDYDDPLTDGEVSYERGITADKFNPRKGRVVDGESIYLVDNGDGGKMLSLRPVTVPDASTDPNIDNYPTAIFNPIMATGGYTGTGNTMELCTFPDGFVMDQIEIKEVSGQESVRFNGLLCFAPSGSAYPANTQPIKFSTGSQRILTVGSVNTTYKNHVVQNGIAYIWTAYGHLEG